jgi:predicted RNA-binding Zn ribbon-like protein
VPDGPYTYAQYVGNLATLAVDLANAGAADRLTGISAALLDQHRVPAPTPAELAAFLPLLRAALAAVVDGHRPEAVNELLARFPPDLHVSTHGGREKAHLHHARDGEPGLAWLGRSCAAALAHVACDVPDVRIGACAAAGCGTWFVDQSRNRSRRFCGNTCASRTTVAAHRARRRA